MTKFSVGYFAAFLMICFSVVSYVSQAHAYRDEHWRNPQFYVGLGATKELLAITSDNDNSKYDGWAPVGEAGFDLPFTETWGVTLSGEYRQPDTTNSRNDPTWIEKAYVTSTAGKLGLFIGPVVVGAGWGKDSIMIRQVSATTGAQQSTYQGTSTLYFSSLNINLNSYFRLTLEGEYRIGQTDTLRYTDFSGGAKLMLLLP